MRLDKFDYNDIEELLSNTYVISDSENHAVIIDPSSEGDGLLKYLEKNKLTPVAIMLTHGHFDHIRGVNNLLKKYDVPIYIHELDKDFLQDSYLNCSLIYGTNVKIDKEPILVKDNEELHLLNGETIKVIHTPFHTVGSVCYYFLNNNWLFSGDTLFRLSIGRDDLPGSIPKSKYGSLAKLKKLLKDVKIYPGHGQNTVLAAELMLNDFFKG